MLTSDDFPAFFQEVHGDAPFPWQHRLLERIAGTGTWPSVLDLPTGSGKTAALDIALFHLALEAGSPMRRAPVRVAFVVDRRLVVDDAHQRAQRLEQALLDPPGDATARVAARLRQLAGDGPPLKVTRLRGGLPRETDWARTPAQPTLLCSTVDQVGSRLLFRGYGVSDSMKPIHAGLFGSDCLILLDEAHLAQPFRETLDWVRHYQGSRWREASETPWGCALLTATPGEQAADAFSLSAEDHSHPILSARMDAAKPARLIEVKSADGTAGKSDDDSSVQTTQADDRTPAMISELRNALRHFGTAHQQDRSPAIGIVVNRVARARAVFEAVSTTWSEEIRSGTIAAPMLLIGPARAVDRDGLVADLAPIRTRRSQPLARPLIIVATQCIEAGVDIDLDGLITEAAPLDALRQRFGRLNRGGRPIQPFAAILGFSADTRSRANDAVYGSAIAATWTHLQQAAKGPDSKRGVKMVGFGINEFSMTLDPAVLSPRAGAPVLLPAHLDLLSQTAPIPAADPDVSLYLHGRDRQADSISVIWRADIDPDHQSGDAVRRLLSLVPPRAAEAIELPLWVVRRWLRGDRRALRDLADTAGAMADDEDDGHARRSRRVFRWKGDTEASDWVNAGEVKPGDAIVVPAAVGGVDAFGWNPDSTAPATDVAAEAAASFRGNRFAVRIAPGLIQPEDLPSLAAVAAETEASGWKNVCAALRAVPMAEGIRADLARLEEARGGRVAVLRDLHGRDEDGRPRGIVFVAERGLAGRSRDADPSACSEDDGRGSMPGFAQPLVGHCQAVADMACGFAQAAGLPVDMIADVTLAALLHDTGKADARFQAWLHYDDPLGPDLSQPDDILAKSGRPIPRGIRTELPERWRHEALSVRLAEAAPRLQDAHDPALVLWLIGTHHGHGRPLFPHQDPADARPRALPELPDLDVPAKLPPGHGPQSLGWNWHGLDWATLYARLKARYGTWELARLEAIVRLADHRASEAAARTAEEAE